MWLFQNTNSRTKQRYSKCCVEIQKNITDKNKNKISWGFEGSMVGYWEFEGSMSGYCSFAAQ